MRYRCAFYGCNLNGVDKLGDCDKGSRESLSIMNILNHFYIIFSVIDEKFTPVVYQIGVTTQPRWRYRPQSALE
jgi:hypothetical protein